MGSQPEPPPGDSGCDVLNVSALDPGARDEQLKRELSRLSIGLLAINGLIGAGIFGLPSEAAKLVGPYSPVVFLVCGLLMSTVMVAFAQLASYFSGTGGPILYTQTAFGRFVGFQTGWLIYVGRVTSIGANVNLLATYLASFIPGADHGWWRIGVVFVVIAIFTVLNVVGVKQGMSTVAVLTFFKLIPLVVFIVVGLAYVRAEPFAPTVFPGVGSFGEAVLLVFYAFIGFEGAVIPAGETRDPQRNIPRALIAVAAITTVLYLLIQIVSVGVLPDLASSTRPLADVAAISLGAFGVVLMSVGAIVSILGNTAASLLSAPRMTYALALDHNLPRWFGNVHERYRTPYNSVIVYGAIAFVLAATGTFTWLAGMSSFIRILGYCMCIAAIPRLKARFGSAPMAFRMPGGYFIPGVALVICAWLASLVKLDAVLFTLGFVAAGAVLYRLGRRSHPVES